MYQWIGRTIWLGMRIWVASVTTMWLIGSVWKRSLLSEYPPSPLTSLDNTPWKKVPEDGPLRSGSARHDHQSETKTYWGMSKKQLDLFHKKG